MYDPTKPYKKQIIKIIETTWNTPYAKVKDGLVFKKNNFPEYHHSDGIGTKGYYHWQKRSFKSAVTDALAMNLNDLAMVNAVPYATIDHLILPEDDRKAILEIMRHLASECHKRKIVISGGETAIHNDFESMEISISMLGFVKKQKENKFRNSDILIGLASSGLHSNGFSKVREVFKNKFDSSFIKPTLIYADLILELNQNFDISGMMHITGGALTKLKDLLDQTDAEITNKHSLKPQKIFYELFNQNITDKEMYRTFNCGVGFIFGIKKGQARDCLRSIKNFKADIIGEIVKGKEDICIESMFSKGKIIY